MGDYRAGDVRCGDRVINSVRVVAGRVGSDRQSCWDRRRCERCWDSGWDSGWYQAGRTRGDQSGEQNLFYFFEREGEREKKKINKIDRN